MKKTIVFLIAPVCLLVVWYSIVKLNKEQNITNDKNVNVLLVYNPNNISSENNIKEAYESVLLEEGVAFKAIEVTQLLSLSAGSIAVNNPVLIFPDNIAQQIHDETKSWLMEYLSAGGNIAVIYNAGVKDKKGRYLEKAVFSEITGLNYERYSKKKEHSYGTGYFQLYDKKKSDYFQFPRGKLDSDNYLCGYKYGKLKYPAALNELTRPLDPEEIYAYTVLEDKTKYPALVVRKHDKGSILYANMPLGYLKTTGDDLPLRSVLRTFLFKIVKIPHLMSTPFGRGGIVINWHIDASPDYPSITSVVEKEIIRKSLECSLHITAGDFRDAVGDKIGFDAEGEGKPYVEIVKTFGVLGCHGGWAHNWFAKNVEDKTFRADKIRYYIKKNKDALERLVGYKIEEYSAPEGTHPQPENTEVLNALGMIAYYYTGDSGSAPNRTFSDGKMVSDKVIAFPVMPNHKYASLFEMEDDDLTAEEIGKWLLNIGDYVYENKTVRLFYSHLRDVSPLYEIAFKNFLDHLENLQSQKKIIVKPMGYFAKFFLRCLKSEYSFNQNNGKLAVTLKNPEGLNEITAAIPKHKYRVVGSNDCTVSEDDDYYYLTVKEKLNEAHITAFIN